MVRVSGLEQIYVYVHSSFNHRSIWNSFDELLYWSQIDTHDPRNSYTIVFSCWDPGLKSSCWVISLSLNGFRKFTWFIHFWERAKGKKECFSQFKKQNKKPKTTKKKKTNIKPHLSMKDLWTENIIILSYFGAKMHNFVRKLTFWQEYGLYYPWKIAVSTCSA